MQQTATSKRFLEFLLAREDELQLPGQQPDSWTAEVLSGNINRVYRIVLNYGCDQRSFVVKQVPEGGWLERYPAISFPQDRLQYELNWFKQADAVKPDYSVRPPTVYACDHSYQTIVMEDFGYGPNITNLLLSDPSSMKWVRNVGKFMGVVHARTLETEPVSNPSAEMNRQFVFTLAIEKPDAVRQLWQEKYNRTGAKDLQLLIDLQKKFLQQHGEAIYPVVKKLERGFKTREFTAFTHGDLHGQSLIATPFGSTGIVDAELADTGDPAFDIGTLLGHIWALMRKTGANTDTMSQYAYLLWKNYSSSFIKHTGIRQEDMTGICLRVKQYAGAELIRRLIGAAEFPFQLPTGTKCLLLSEAVTLLTHPEMFKMAQPDRPFQISGLLR